MGIIFATYLRIPLIKKLLFGFILGSLVGGSIWYLDSQGTLDGSVWLNQYISPFGTVFIQMLKMVVVPIVFFTLLLGAANLPLSSMGKIGLKLMGFYLLTSLISAVFGVVVALWMNPGSGTQQQWQAMADKSQTANIVSQNQQANGGLSEIMMSMFGNPFESLAQSNFLGMIVFSILIGLGLSAVKEKAEKDSQRDVVEGFDSAVKLLNVLNHALYVVVNWIMEYAPIGVFALSIVNFGLYGPDIVGPYVKVVGGIVLGIFAMIFIAYPVLIKIFSKHSVTLFFKHVKEPMLTAFVTRSSAAALPVSMDTAVNKLDIEKEIASFSLPMGATINMDGVCIHLPMFAILATNLFQIPMGFSELLILVISTVFAAIGTGGVPGGSIMLLFIVLGSLGLSEQQTALVVALALGVNPILDMFETMNNVTGDLMCAYLLKGDKKQDSLRS